jgi:hypothetical protein
MLEILQRALIILSDSFPRGMTERTFTLNFEELKERTNEVEIVFDYVLITISGGLREQPNAREQLAHRFF